MGRRDFLKGLAMIPPAILLTACARPPTAPTQSNAPSNLGEIMTRVSATQTAQSAPEILKPDTEATIDAAVKGTMTAQKDISVPAKTTATKESTPFPTVKQHFDSKTLSFDLFDTPSGFWEKPEAMEISNEDQSIIYTVSRQKLPGKRGMGLAATLEFRRLPDLTMEDVKKSSGVGRTAKRLNIPYLEGKSRVGSYNADYWELQYSENDLIEFERSLFFQDKHGNKWQVNFTSDSSVRDTAEQLLSQTLETFQAKSAPKSETKPAYTKPAEVARPAEIVPGMVSRPDIVQTKVDGADWIYDTHAYAIAFKPSIRGILSHIELPIRVAGKPTTPLTAEIRTEDNTKHIQATPLITENATAETMLRNPSGQVSFFAGKDLEVLGGKTYYVLVSSAGQKDVGSSYVWKKAINDNPQFFSPLPEISSFRVNIPSNSWDRDAESTRGIVTYMKIDPAGAQRTINAEPLSPHLGSAFAIDYPQSWQHQKRTIPENEQIGRIMGRKVDVFIGDKLGNRESLLGVGVEQVASNASLDLYQKSVEGQILQQGDLVTSITNRAPMRVGSENGVLLTVSVDGTPTYIAVAKKGSFGYRITLVPTPLTGPEQLNRFKEKILPSFKALS